MPTSCWHKEESYTMNSNLNSQILALSTSLLSKYEMAEGIVGQIESSETVFSGQARLFDELGAIMQEIKSIEARLSESKALADSSGVVLAKPIQDCIDKTVQIVLRLIPRLAALESTAKQYREAYGPEIHRGVRAIEMQAAYTAKNP